MKYTKLDSKPNLPQIQSEILRFWKDHHVFEKSVEKNEKGEVVFYDGPPFPTGKPHNGTVLVSFIKDMVARYWTMRGYSVPRVWGWDCHGLPIETQAEIALGIKDKSEIESTIGIGKFNDVCQEIVSSNNEAWKEYVEEMARWVDYEGAYKTMDLNYMESVLWIFKQCYDKGLIYKDYKVTPYCFRCETSLSISDTRESDSTRPKQDPWVIAKFEADQTLNGKQVYLLAWTTTPWTLPSNMALAVSAELKYAYIAVGEEILIVCENALPRYEKLFGKNPVIVKRCKGKDIVGIRYIPLFDYFIDKRSENAFVVIPVDFVDPKEGIGIVHIAPAFGEDDNWACKSNNIPLVNPVDSKGMFTKEVRDFADRNVLEANHDIIRFLKNSGKVIADGTIEHNYPHCWRCRTPLIYKAVDAWFFAINKIKDRLIENNNNINWIPETIKFGRFGNWLSNARDWNISRNRYWSTPIPVWECESCKKRIVLGSIEEIYKASGQKLTNLHRQYMDKITFKCECGGTAKRIPEVLDCWFESGSVPYAQKHYPFENREWFESHYPCDFLVEYTGQIRCWFYYLHVLATALFDKSSFKNCIVHGTVLAKDGKKLSKSSKNYTDPMELMKKYGTDAFRLYMYQSGAMLIGDLLFDEAGLRDVIQQILLPFWNSCSFYISYAVIDGFFPGEVVDPNPANQLDKWILAKLYKAEKNITEKMDNYQVDQYVKHIVSLLDGLTNWYIRRSRRRFWGNGLSKDKGDAYETLLYVLVNTCKLFAPIAPILSERLYKNLTGGESVHLTDWPIIPEKYCDVLLLEEIDLVQKVIYLARLIRTKNNIKNRQPLMKVQVAFVKNDNIKIIEKSKYVICEELNVKELEYIENIEDIALIQYKPNFHKLGTKYGNLVPSIIKAINEKRFEIGENSIFLMLNNDKLELDTDDIILSYQAKTGLHIMSDQGIVVSLDLKITEELKREGIAREIIRNIQDARKQLDCDIMERIGIRFIQGVPPEEWIEYICSETLGSVQEFDNADAQCDIQTDNGGIITIGIKRDGIK
jgi:isoleucyl-tRNA synthetase